MFIAIKSDHVVLAFWMYLPRICSGCSILMQRGLMLPVRKRVFRCVFIK